MIMQYLNVVYELLIKTVHCKQYIPNRESEHSS